MMTGHTTEVATGQRFAFGENWTRFLQVLNEERIQLAEQSLRRMLDVANLQGKRFLDIGSGSGLFSLAARRLGATVHSFDYDPLSVACTRELKRRYFPEDRAWLVEEASALDQEYLSGLGKFEVVYSWGVLHHTGAMWQALENIAPLVAGRGKLIIAIYNDQGRTSDLWKRIKRTYCASPMMVKKLIILAAILRLWGPTTVRDLFHGYPGKTWQNYGKDSSRGMSPWRDVVDWVGGYPFEVAKPEDIFDFYRLRQFRLERFKTCAGGHGCNEFLFTQAQ